MNKRSLLPFFLTSPDGVPPGGAPAGDAPPAGGQVPPAADGQPPAPTPGQAPQSDDVKALRDEAAKYRIQNKENAKALAEATAKLKALEDAGKTAEQKASEELESLRRFKVETDTTLNTWMIKEAVTRHSLPSSLNIVDPDAAFALIDKTDLIKEGKLNEAELKTRLTALMEAKPWLKPQAAAPTKPTPPGINPTNAGKGNGVALTRDMLKTMSTAEINARWDEVQLLIKT